MFFKTTKGGDFSSSTDGVRIKKGGVINNNLRIKIFGDKVVQNTKDRSDATT